MYCRKKDDRSVVKKLDDGKYKTSWGQVLELADTEVDSIPNIYADAVEVQNACNFSGVVMGFKTVMEVVNFEMNEQGEGQDYLYDHPAIRCFVYKMMDMLDLYSLEEAARSSKLTDALMKCATLGRICVHCHARDGKHYPNCTKYKG
jgi:hypothetical protein